MATVSSKLVEENSCRYSSEEEDKSQCDENILLKEEPCVRTEQRPLAASFFYRMDREVFHFVHQEIIIQEALDSFAASTWPAAPALCQYMERHRKELDLVDKAVLEIGSGTGLVSIVAALLGAWVTATDLPHALSNLRLNLSKNTRGKCRHTPQVAALSWSFDLEHTYPTSVYHYDYLLAADVVYHHDFLDELLATMKHFCRPGTTLLWANKVRMVNDVDFTEKFMKMFNTKLVFEDGNMRIFMATHREEVQNVEAIEFRGEKEAPVGDKNNSEELCDDDEDEDVDYDKIEEEEEEKKEEEPGVESLNGAAADSPVPASKEDPTDQSSFGDNSDGTEKDYYNDDDEKKEEDEEEETGKKNLNRVRADSAVPDKKEDSTDQSSLILLRDNRRSDEVVQDDDDDDEEEEEEEEESGDDDSKEEEAAVSTDPDSGDDTAEQQLKVKSFSWSASVMRGLGKDTYHFVGTDIDIYECINFNESADAYGAMMWPAALALCAFLEKNQHLLNLEDKSVLELGAGTGLVAIVASLLGAKVTATDLPNFLGNLQANVMRNTRGRSRHLPQISPLTWSFDVGRVYPSHLYQFDFVLAADVVYHHQYLDELLSTMSHFCHPRTTIIWANKIRIVTDIQFTEKFKKEFNTTLLAEDGDMKIFMGKFKM